MWPGILWHCRVFVVVVVALFFSLLHCAFGPWGFFALYVQRNSPFACTNYKDVFERRELGGRFNRNWIWHQMDRIGWVSIATLIGKWLSHHSNGPWITWNLFSGPGWSRNEDYVRPSRRVDIDSELFASKRWQIKYSSTSLWQNVFVDKGNWCKTKDFWISWEVLEMTHFLVSEALKALKVAKWGTESGRKGMDGWNRYEIWDKGEQKMCKMKTNSHDGPNIFSKQAETMGLLLKFQ